MPWLKSATILVAYAPKYFAVQRDILFWEQREEKINKYIIAQIIVVMIRPRCPRVPKRKWSLSKTPRTSPLFKPLLEAQRMSRERSLQTTMGPLGTGAMVLKCPTSQNVGLLLIKLTTHWLFYLASYCNE